MIKLVIVESPTKVPILFKFYYCYILKSKKNNQYYIGSTNNLEKRLKEHNSLKVKSTKHGALWEMVHEEQFNTLKEARRREGQIKKWKSRKAIEILINKI